MSLVVWLPLNGNLENQGLSNMTFSYIQNNGALSVNNSGKIGKCYERTTSAKNDLIRSSTTINLSGDISMACWAYVTGTIGDTANGLVTNHSHADSTGVGITVKQVSTGDYRISCNTGTGSSRTYCTYYGKTNIKNAWHHLVLTYDKTAKQLQLWVDGKVECTLNNYVNASKADYIDIFNWSTTYYTEEGYRPTCKLNDIRIYDHALSAKEVKELAKGLVLHYRLAGPGGANLLPHTSPEYGLGYMTSYQGGTISWSNEKQYNGHNTIKIQPSSNTTSSGGYVNYNNNVDLISGKTYTYSCMIYSTIDDTFDFVSLGHFQTYNSTDSHNRTIQKDSNTVKANIWTKVYITFTPTANVKFYSFFIYFANTSQTIYITDIKLEEGSIATPWVPNSADSLYSTLGYNNGIEYDCSGYQRNGIKSGTITWDIDSPRYTTSYHFSNSQFISYTENLTFLTTGSISFWAKFNTKGSAGWLPFTGQTGRYYVMATSKGTGDFYNDNVAAVGTIKYYEDSKAVSAPKNDGKWHHYVITGINMSGWTTFKINNYSPEWNSDVNYSDVRVYNTVLSEEDIAELYHSAVIVDNTGKSYAYEYFEAN